MCVIEYPLQELRKMILTEQWVCHCMRKEKVQNLLLAIRETTEPQSFSSLCFSWSEFIFLDLFPAAQKRPPQRWTTGHGSLSPDFRILSSELAPLRRPSLCDWQIYFPNHFACIQNGLESECTMEKLGVWVYLVSETGTIIIQPGTFEKYMYRQRDKGARNFFHSLDPQCNNSWHSNQIS